jgi:nucleotide-binding universal stress UspA family protein
MGKGTMRILLATDGSEPAMLAQKLIASIAWPSGTHILVLHVMQDAVASLGISPSPAYPVPLEELRGALDAELAETKRALSGTGRTIETKVSIGRPASAIVDEARAISADLIGIGSHGRGAVASALLGSVAAEVVDHAPCPVLVARAEQVTGIVLAHDGSPGAAQAEAILVAFEFLRGLPVRVVSAWDVAPAYLGTDPTGGTFVSGDMYTQLIEDARRYATTVASEAAARLSQAGLKASAQVVESSPTEGIVAAAGPTDLIVMGTRGRTGLARLLLGSVARGVLHRARSSALFVPQAAPRR